MISNLPTLDPKLCMFTYLFLKSYDTYPNPMIPVYPMILKIGRFLETFLQEKPNYEDDYKIIKIIILYFMHNLRFTNKLII